MTRAEAKVHLTNLGIAEPTDEIISNYLNQVNGETQKEKNRAEQYKKEADKASELQAKLDEINNQNLSDIEKANKSLEASNNRVAELESKIRAMEIKDSLAKVGITGESADKFFSEDGSVNFENLGAILANVKSVAALEKESEIAGKAGNPGGGSTGAENDTRTEAEKYVAEHFSANTTFGDNLKAYL